MRSDIYLLDALLAVLGLDVKRVLLLSVNEVLVLLSRVFAESR